jgi:Helix-turn-helix domain
LPALRVFYGNCGASRWVSIMKKSPFMRDMAMPGGGASKPSNGGWVVGQPVQMRQRAELTGPPPIFLSAGEAAAFLRVSSVTLGRWRIEGCGPTYRKFGRRVLYERADLIAWAEAQTRVSTSETGNLTRQRKAQ